jgi:nucleoid-associated protein YgaU
MGKFEDLKQKYQSVLRSIEQNQIRMEHLHEQDNKLFLKGTAPSDEAKNKIWDQIKLVNPQHDDIIADISVAETRAQAATAPGGQTSQTYTVQSGDTLSKISKQFYGDANEYMRIFEANRDKLKDPDRIQAGQVLTIPRT